MAAPPYLPSILSRGYSRHHPHGKKARFIYGPNNNPICFVESPLKKHPTSIDSVTQFFSLPFNGKFGSALGLNNELLSFPKQYTGYTESGQLTVDTIRALDFFKGLSNVSNSFYGTNSSGFERNIALAPINESWREAFRDFCFSIYQRIPEKSDDINSQIHFGMLSSIFSKKMQMIFIFTVNTL